MSAQQELGHPQYLDPKELYGLQDGERVLYSMNPEIPVRDLVRELPPEEIDQDPAVIDLHARALADAQRIGSLPTTVDEMGMASELQGYYTDVRVIPARHDILGFRIKGWTLIGVPRDPGTIVYGPASM